MTEPLDRDGAPLAPGDRCLIVVWRDPCRFEVLGRPVQVGGFWPFPAFCASCGSLHVGPVVDFTERQRSPHGWVSGCPASWLKKLPPLSTADRAETLGYEHLAKAIRSSTLIKEKT